MIASVAGQHEADAPDRDVPGAEGLSAFVAKVLDQLSLSAWLPAAFGVANVTILLQFASDRSLNLTEAIDKLTKDPVKVLILVLPCLILSTLVAQAFSFQAIRLLEGYWRLPPMSWIRAPMITLHLWRRRRLGRTRSQVAAKAVDKAVPEMIRASVPYAVIRAFQAQARDEPVPELGDADSSYFAKVNWRNWCSPVRLARVDHLVAEERAYPITSRTLPTKLGNTLRKTEDELVAAGGDVQGYAFRGREALSQRVQLQHDQYRTRLDMYSTLVFVCLFLTALTPIVIRGPWASVLAAGAISCIYLILAIVSHMAALASARGYCTVLKEMQRRLALAPRS
jgi:hypothetical protein